MAEQVVSGSQNALPRLAVSLPRRGVGSGLAGGRGQTRDLAQIGAIVPKVDRAVYPFLKETDLSFFMREKRRRRSDFREERESGLLLSQA
jgi:hypothetical protein